MAAARFSGRAGFALLVAFAASGAARAQAPLPAHIVARSTACQIANCVDSGVQTGDPAPASATGHFAATGYSFDATGDLSLSRASLSATVSSSGFTDISSFSATGAAAVVDGDLLDYLTVSGGSGAAFFHLPIQVVGAVTISWSVQGQYVPPPSYPPGAVRLRIACVVTDVATGTPASCDDPDTTWTSSASVDTTYDLVWPVTFDQQFALTLHPQISATVSAANGAAGTLTAAANGDFSPGLVVALGRVTDGSGADLPGVSVQSESGFAYVQPVPEPAAWNAALASLGCLYVLARRRRWAR